MKKGNIARLVKSASRPMSKDDLRKEKEERELPDGQVDKNGNPLKFCKDLESDWSVPCGIRKCFMFMS